MAGGTWNADVVFGSEVVTWEGRMARRSLASNTFTLCRLRQWSTAELGSETCLQIWETELPQKPHLSIWLQHRTGLLLYLVCGADRSSSLKKYSRTQQLAAHHSGVGLLQARMGAHACDSEDPNAHSDEINTYQLNEPTGFSHPG